MPLTRHDQRYKVVLGLIAAETSEHPLPCHSAYVTFPVLCVCDTCSLPRLLYWCVMPEKFLHACMEPLFDCRVTVAMSLGGAPLLTELILFSVCRRGAVPRIVAGRGDPAEQGGLPQAGVVAWASALYLINLCFLRLNYV